MSVCNGLVNPVTKAITAAEAWDYSQTKINNEIWRIWFGKVFNFLIIIVVSFEVATDNKFLPGEGSAADAAEPYEG